MKNDRHKLSISYATSKLTDYRIKNKIPIDAELSGEEKDIFKMYYNYAYKNLKE